MPLVQIRSLPPVESFDVASAVERVSATLARVTDSDPAHFMVTWDFIEAGHYAHAGRVAGNQPAQTHPVLVNLLAPDLTSSEAITAMLDAVADVVAEISGVDRSNVFAVYRAARSGEVLDAGAIVTW